MALQTIAVLWLSGSAGAALLELEGEQNQIKFGGPQQAVLSATCATRQASVAWMTPSTIAVLSGQPKNISIYLKEVALSCAGADLDTPCAAGTQAFPGRPVLFTCVYTFNEFTTPTSTSSLPVDAELVSHMHDGELLGLQVMVNCPALQFEDLYTLSNYAGTGELDVKVSLKHGNATIPFLGPPGGDMVRFTDLPTPPIAPPSPSPPPPPNTPPPPAPVSPPPADPSTGLVGPSSTCTWGNAGQVHAYMLKYEPSEMTNSHSAATTLWGDFCTSQGESKAGGGYPGSGNGYSQSGASASPYLCAAAFYTDHIVPALSTVEQSEFHHMAVIFHGTASNCYGHHYERYSMCAWGGECNGSGMAWCRTGTASCSGDVSMSTIADSRPHGSSECLIKAKYHVYLCAA